MADKKNKYVMDDEAPAKNYRVEDDREIRGAGFSNLTEEEKRLKAEVDKWSTKSSVACILLSLIHCHYFYVGRFGRGLLCLFTANFLYIGMIIDWVMLLGSRFKDKDGRIVNSANRFAAEAKLNEFYRANAQK